MERINNKYLFPGWFEKSALVAFPIETLTETHVFICVCNVGNSEFPLEGAAGFKLVLSTFFHLAVEMCFSDRIGLDVSKSLVYLWNFLTNNTMYFRLKQNSFLDFFLCCAKFRSA